MNLFNYLKYKDEFNYIDSYKLIQYLLEKKKIDLTIDILV